ncbi:MULTISPECIES: LuxR C-terminal-related transcriptional regulator [unclassified Arthrobacter]|uniref:LuxR C-terminal-related transcriptional regulator n=1 Tax=unclassified Arthrobacter TaxID=235627 RepID=UPI0021051E0A|nr:MULTISPECIES: LuxR C-terminal-related transcriptional regulator [unclassified Arthrobacter]MCQ1947835.1 LuxR C-terminal-related transcriptional regulator [Arthrobacter sp. zg-Y1116]MCQ1996261.1 LuxR C-terminal-related transcriptional regulator [Arthrobacter sp. zg-Y1171]UWX82688.1 LuxR C-terminal-related transcriptional regulator [Arthrobacter sp. zg-Y1171]
MEVAGRTLTASSRNPGSETGNQLGEPLLAQVKNAVAGALEALSEDRSVVVTGAAGTGKSTAMAGILAGLGDRYSVLQLRGAASWAEKPFAGLFWLLSELPPEALSDPVYVLQFLRRVFKGKAAGRRLVLAIENVEDMDAATIAVLLQLCRTGSALMLATVRDLSACTSEFVRWWSEDSVHREVLEPLRPGGTRVLLEGLAGGTVSSRLVAQVQARSRGNPLLSSVFLREQMDAGTVVRRRGIWVWTGSVSYSGALAERVEAETGGLSTAERFAADVLAVSGALPILLLLQVADPPAVERLEQNLLVSSGSAGFLRFKDPLLAEAAAALVPPGRAAEIRSRLASVQRQQKAEDNREPSPAAEMAAARVAAQEAGKLSRSGRWTEASAAAQAGLELADRCGITGRWRRDLLSELFCVFLRCGELRHAADVLAKTGEAVEGMELRGGNDLCEGIVQVLDGRADRALDSLQRAVAQFEAEGTEDLVPLAESAAAYACVLLGDGDAARGYLTAAGAGARQRTGGANAPSTDAGARTFDWETALTRSFSGLCAVYGVTIPGGNGEFTTVAAHGGPEGLPEAMLVLAAAALHGRPGAAEELREAAAGCSGESAQMYLELAEGLTALRPASLLRAAERAHGLGQYLTAHGAAGEAVRLARAQSDRARLRAARRLENASYRLLRAANSVADRLPELSDFERELALGAAAGKNSSQLAGGLHLSPRTVDWHLGRIFQKLRVSGRAELRECLEAERPRN